jgi:hypothetical protein
MKAFSHCMVNICIRELVIQPLSISLQVSVGVSGTFGRLPFTSHPQSTFRQNVCAKKMDLFDGFSFAAACPD